MEIARKATTTKSIPADFKTPSKSRRRKPTNISLDGSLWNRFKWHAKRNKVSCPDLLESVIKQFIKDSMAMADTSKQSLKLAKKSLADDELISKLHVEIGQVFENNRDYIDTLTRLAECYLILGHRLIAGALKNTKEINLDIPEIRINDDFD